MEGSSAYLLELIEGNFTKKLKTYQTIFIAWITNNVRKEEQAGLVNGSSIKIANIKGRNFYNNLVAWIYEYYLKIDTTFMSKLDTSTTLVAFTNGVYELDTDNFTKSGCRLITY